jgi:hypothetical protein
MDGSTFMMRSKLKQEIKEITCPGGYARLKWSGKRLFVKVGSDG